MKVSTGIGAGLISDGRLYHGAGGTAGEIGHTIIDERGPFCRCGNRGCLETLAGAAALVELLRGTHGAELDHPATAPRWQQTATPAPAAYSPTPGATSARRWPSCATCSTRS